MKRNLYFIVPIILASLIIMVDNIITFRHAYKLAEDTAKLQTLGIAVSLEAALKGIGSDDYLAKGNIFTDIINEGRWEGIAFIALYDKDGKILLHSNRNLIGRIVNDSLLSTVNEEVNYGYIELGTGERVFTINMPVHTVVSEEHPVLRVAIHTHEMEKIKGSAFIKAVAMSVVLFILWVFAWFLWRTIRRNDRLLEAMMERQRLASIGEMAAVLAHEIRNPLGSIKGFAQFILECTDKDDHREALDIIVRESKRLESLTEDLLIYARPMEVKKEYFNINSLIIEVVKGFNDSHSGVNAEVYFDVHDFYICSDKDKIRQALLNLLNNAKDAIGSGGLVQVRLSKLNDGAVLLVKDNGTGIEEAIAKDIFKPFFTTKAKGTGLGLAIVKKICEVISGDITFSSDKRGTEFRLFIRGLRCDEQE